MSKTTADLIRAALINARLANSQLDKALKQHQTPHSLHALELVKARSEIADAIHKLEVL